MEQIITKHKNRCYLVFQVQPKCNVPPSFSLKTLGKKVSLYMATCAILANYIFNLVIKIIFEMNMPFV